MVEARQDGPGERTLPELLLHRVRQTSDRRLVLDAALGIAIAAAATIFTPPFWLPLVTLAGSLGAYGVWGILDRELGDAGAGTRRARVLSAARSAVGVLGALVAVLFGVTVFFGMLGTWIS